MSNRKSFFILTTSITLGFLTACGGSGGSDDPSPVLPVIELPNLVSSLPADGAVSVKVIDSVTLTFDQPLNQDHVEALNIKITTKSDTPNSLAPIGKAGHTFIPFETSINNNELIIDPVVPLLHGYTYEIAVNNHQFEFTTYYNRPTQITLFDSQSPESPRSYYIYDSNSEFNYEYFSGPGDDAEWFTNDDIRYSFQTETRDDNGRLTLIENFGSPSRLNYYTQYNRSSNGDLASTVWYFQGVSEGNDGVLGTSDDIPESYVTFDYSTSENTIQKFWSPGVDNQWMTADDQKELHEVEKINSSGTLDAKYRFNSSGTDNVWGTNDDNLYEGTQFQYDSLGNLLREALVSDSGNDQVYYTSDDTIFWGEEFNYESNLPIQSNISKEAGNDNQWFTGDDIYLAKVSYEYNSDGQKSVERTTFPGADSEFETADDYTRLVEIEYDENGNRTKYTLTYLNFMTYPDVFVSRTVDYDTSK